MSKKDWLAEKAEKAKQEGRKLITADFTPEEWETLAVELRRSGEIKHILDDLERQGQKYLAKFQAELMNGEVDADGNYKKVVQRSDTWPHHLPEDADGDAKATVEILHNCHDLRVMMVHRDPEHVARCAFDLGMQLARMEASAALGKVVAQRKRAAHASEVRRSKAMQTYRRINREIARRARELRVYEHGAKTSITQVREEYAKEAGISISKVIRASKHMTPFQPAKKKKPR